MGTTSQKLTYLNTTKQLLKTEINKINNVLDDNSTFRSYPQELFNGYIDILNNGTDTLWNNLEKVSQTGTEAVLEGVETAPIKMVLNGNTSQDGEPTPDTPVEVKVVKGNNVVSVQGKNLFDKSSVSLGSNWNGAIGTTCYPFNSQITRATVLIPVEPSTTYHLKLTQSEWYSMQILEASSTYEVLQTDSSVVSNNVDLQITTLSNTAYIGIKFKYGSAGTTEMVESLLSSLILMLNKGTTALPYEPYTGASYPINLPVGMELCKINTYKDYFHKDSGKWYEHKEIRKVVFDGSESWNLSSLGAGKFYLEISPIFKMISGTVRGIKPYSSHFVGKDNSLDFENGKVVLMTSSYGGTTHYFTRFENDNTPTLSEWKTWLSNNNVKLYYVLATPTETEITNSTLIEQLEAIYKAKSVKDKTYVTQTNDDLPFILDVSAIKEYEVN